MLVFAAYAWGRSWPGFRHSSFGFAGLPDRPLQSSMASTSQGRPAVVVPSFISTFVPPSPLLALSQANSVAACSPQSGLPTSFAANPAPILHQPFVVGRDSQRSQQKLSPSVCLENLESLTSFCVPTLCSWNLNRSCCSMGT